MNVWYETLKGLDESTVCKQLAENPVSIEIAEVYSQALTVKDTVIAVAAQDELLKRGDSDYVGERFMEACRTVGIELGTDFADRIAQSLTMTDCDPLLKRLGKQLLNDPESNDAEDEIDKMIKDAIAPQLSVRKKASISELLDGVELDGIEREADDKTKEAIRRYGKYIELSPANA